MNKHSPGPWKFRKAWHLDGDPDQLPLDYGSPGYYDNPAIVDANGDTVTGHNEYNVFEGPNQAANVALMLAAPDLLEAAEEVVNIFKKYGSDFSMEKSDFKHLLAAIAKAKGEQP